MDLFNLISTYEFKDYILPQIIDRVINYSSESEVIREENIIIDDLLYINKTILKSIELDKSYVIQTKNYETSEIRIQYELNINGSKNIPLIPIISLLSFIERMISRRNYNEVLDIFTKLNKLIALKFRDDINSLFTAEDVGINVSEVNGHLEHVNPEYIIDLMKIAERAVDYREERSLIFTFLRIIFNFLKKCKDYYLYTLTKEDEEKFLGNFYVINSLLEELEEDEKRILFDLIKKLDLSRLILIKHGIKDKYKRKTIRIVDEKGSKNADKYILLSPISGAENTDLGKYLLEPFMFLYVRLVLSKKNVPYVATNNLIINVKFMEINEEGIYKPEKLTKEADMIILFPPLKGYDEYKILIIDFKASASSIKEENVIKYRKNN